MANDILQMIWPEWEVEKKLGSGAFGVVYQAVRRDYNVESRAAIKVISIPSNESEIASLRSEGLDFEGTRTYMLGIVNDFVSEIQLMESLKGVQNIVSVEDYKVVERTESLGWDIFIRMELLTPFNEYARDRLLSEQEVTKLGYDICSALEICSKRNIIHRDIKPENIFVNDFGDFKLGDFGIARKLENVSGGLSQKGTINYMAPEVVSGTDYDARVDIYSLGLVLYRLLNENRLPFLDSDKQLLSPSERKLANERRFRGELLPIPCRASAQIANVILRACAYDPRQRFATATDMKQALVEVMNGTYQIVPVTLPAGQEASAYQDAAPFFADGANMNMSMSMSGSGQFSNVQGPNPNPEQQPIGKTKKKKSKLPILLAAVVVVVLLGVVLVPRLIGPKEEPKGESQDPGSVAAISGQQTGEDAGGTPVPNEAAKEKEADQSQAAIAAILADAQALADAGDYEGALSKVQEGTASYPDDASLKEKATEYTAAIDQKQQVVLDEAAALAEKEDYLAAMDVLSNALKEEENEAFQSAYDGYLGDYKDKMFQDADALAGSGDYSGAIQKVQEASAALGGGEEFDKKVTDYEARCITGAVAKADASLETFDFDSAAAALDAALGMFPDNEQLLAKKAALEEERASFENSPSTFLLASNPPYQTAGYHTEKTYSLAGNTYMNGFHLDNNGGISYFNLGGRYNVLSFDVGHVDGKDLETGYYYIYLDGVLENTLKLDPSMMVEHVDIRVSGVKQLMIQGGDWSSCYALTNIMITGNPDNSPLQASSIPEGAQYLLAVNPPYQSAGYHTEKTYVMTGITYMNGFHLTDNQNGVAYFNLGGKYDVLSFDVGHIDGTDLQLGTYYFYTDDTLVNTLTLDPSMMVEHIEIPVANVRQLVVQGGSWSECYALTNIAVTENPNATPVSALTLPEGAQYLLMVNPPYQTKGYYTEKSYSLAGEPYMNGFNLEDNEGGVAYFNLNGAYSTLSFDAGHIDGKDLHEGIYYIYLDGALVETLNLEQGMMVEHFEIPVDGVSQVVFEGGGWSESYALVNVAVY